MSGLVIQSAALDEVKELKLDQHEHDRAFFSPTFSKTWTCNEGNVHTREVCGVIANYTAESMFDLSYVAYRIKNAVKAIFNRSDWQKVQKYMEIVIWQKNSAHIKFAPSTALPGQTHPDSGKVIVISDDQLNHISQTLTQALNLNWKSGEKVKMEGPKDCKVGNVVNR